MAIVAVLPIGLLTAHLHDAAWKDSWREIREKHQLLAENLSEPIAIYVSDQRELLRLVSHTITSVDRPQTVLEDVLLDTSGFAALALVSRDGQLLGLAHRDADGSVVPGTDRESGQNPGQNPGHDSGDHAAENAVQNPGWISNEPCFRLVRDSREPFISGIKRSPLSGRVGVLVGQPVFAPQRDGEEPVLIGVLLGELRLDLIEKLRSGIQFGEFGHSAIVDQHGRVVAHPNGEWVAQMRDISKLSVVREMMAGRTGVTEFYSPHMKADMVVGYTSVPEIGWGVMVPQPKAEVQTRIDAMMLANYRWISAGLLLAAALGVAMALWIIAPINRLAKDASQLVESDLDGSIRDAGVCAPREVRQLGSALVRLVARLQGSRREVERLNADLQSRIADATSQLREANQRLAVVADSDHLTGLANRRHFEHEVARIRAERRGRPAQRCVMLVDIDHFKRINDSGGHALGDRALQRVADVLAAQMRGDDLLARYGGDEFAAYLDGDPVQAMRRAERIRQAVADSKLDELVETTDQSMREAVLEALGQLTVSIGLYCHAAHDKEHIDIIMQRADEAMYRAKRHGRNQVILLSPDSSVAAND